MRQRYALIACLILSCSHEADPNMDLSVQNPMTTLKNGSRLHNKYINAADGTVTMGSGLYDTEQQVDCTFVQADDGMMRCLPTGAFLQITYFLDAACTQTFAYSLKCSPPLKYAVDYLSPTCGQQNRVFSMTEITTPPANIYYRNGAACTSTPNTFSVYRMYSLGNSVPAATFVIGAVLN